MTNLQKHKKSYPRILISALHGSGAKTIVSLGLTVAFRRRGFKVFPYKKGPDYIDAAWLGKAADQVCRHLDLYLMTEGKINEVFCRQSENNTISIIEGNRGLFDGVDIYGTFSTARIAKLLKIPVSLIVDCKKVTNTVSSLVLGCQTFDSEVPFGGVILNHVSGKRHGELIRKSIEHHTGLSVLGILPNLDIQMPERHLGLTTVQESKDFENQLQLLGDIAEKYLDIVKILDIAKKAPKINVPEKLQTDKISTATKQKVTVGIIKDPAFQFYYPENLEALEQSGASIIEFNSMNDKKIKPVDLLYIGGGFPEVHAEQISKNKSFRESIKKFAEIGMPIYGECGAVIYLGKNVLFNKKKFDMCGIFPLEFELTKKPSGHGYTEVKVDRENPFFPKDMIFKGHEFHYSLPKNWDSESQVTAFSLKKGFGFDGKRDGLFLQNVFATYIHIHANSTPDWANFLIDAAKKRAFTDSN